MAGTGTPHFHNSIGVETVSIGTREFQCMGALPPFDHPHVFLDMGDADEIVCPYCSTLYKYDPKLSTHEAVPAECAVTNTVTEAA